MKCNICHQDKSGIFCSCGYCKDCITKYGHDKCFNMEQKERKNKLREKKK